MLVSIRLILTASLVAAVVDEPYCTVRYRRLCQGKGRHVACQFLTPEQGESCHNYSKINFTNDLKHFVMNYINRRRQRIAAGSERVRGGAYLPRPELMMWVGWDRELAMLAQRLADQCEFVHDECRATVRYPYAGQSVGEVRWRRSSDSEELSALRAVRRVFDAWWGERRRAQPDQLAQPFRLGSKGNVWGHFSQLATWPLRAVGCGAVRHGGTHIRMLLVCDFSHTNMLGQRTIEPGPLARCPALTERRPRSAFPLLCIPVKRPGQESKHNKEDYEEQDDDIADDYDEDATPSNDQMRTSTYRENQVSKLRTERLITARMNVMQRLEGELVSQKLVTERLVNQSRSRRPLFGRMRDAMENEHVEEAEEDLYMPKLRRPVGNEDNGHGARQRWQHTRNRPQRPGVQALLKKPAEKLAQKSLSASLMIDNDDADQLYFDTGFKLQKTPKKQ